MFVTNLLVRSSSTATIMVQDILFTASCAGFQQNLAKRGSSDTEKFNKTDRMRDVYSMLFGVSLQDLVMAGKSE